MGGKHELQIHLLGLYIMLETMVVVHIKECKTRMRKGGPSPVYIASETYLEIMHFGHSAIEGVYFKVKTLCTSCKKNTGQCTQTLSL